MGTQVCLAWMEELWAYPAVVAGSDHVEPGVLESASMESSVVV